MPEYLVIPLDQIDVNLLNPRADTGDVRGLAASIKENGLLQPPAVVPSPSGHDRYLLKYGHRRLAAIRLAGWTEMPAAVFASEAEAEQLIGMLAENLHREDLTSADEAAGFAQLVAFGVAPKDIARRTGRSVERVSTAVAATQLPAAVGDQVLAGRLTLEDAAALAEFEDDSAAHGRLLARAGDGEQALRYAIATERRRRETAENKSKTRQALRDANVTVTSKPAQFPWTSVAQPLRHLADLAGEPISAEQHASCAGHAAFVDDTGEAVYVCQHPKEFGHKVTNPSYQHLSPEEAARREADALAEAALAEALHVATEVRRQHLRDLLTRKRPPAGAVRDSLRALGAAGLGQQLDLELVLSIAGFEPAEETDLEAAWQQLVDRTTDARQPALALALAAALGEANLETYAWPYRFDPKLAVWWLDWVAAHGYELAAEEQDLRDRAVQAMAARRSGGSAEEGDTTTEEQQPDWPADEPVAEDDAGAVAD